MSGEDNVQKRDIHLMVDGIRHRLTIPCQEETHYRHATEELNRAVLIYRNRFPNSSEVPHGGYLSMAAIDMAYRMRKMRIRLEARDWSERLSQLNALSEQALLSVAEISRDSSS